MIKTKTIAVISRVTKFTKAISEFTNKEMNGCANEEIAQDSKNNSRSTKLKSLVGIIQIPNQ